MKKSFGKIFCTLLLGLVFSSTTIAAVVTIEFSGNINNVENPLGELDGSGIAAGTSTFTGIIMYDTSISTSINTVNPGPNGDIEQWDSVTTVITVDGIYNFDYPLDISNIQNWNSGTGSDRFSTSISGGGSNFAFPAAIGLIDVNLEDTSGTVFSDTSLPLSMSLDDFDIRTLKLRSGQSNDIHYLIEGEITALSTTSVPIPAAAWLFGSGLLGLVGIARRKNVA